MDNTLAAEVVPMDLLGVEERSAKLKMRASLKGIKRPASLSARIGAAVSGTYWQKSSARRKSFGLISNEETLIFPVYVTLLCFILFDASAMYLCCITYSIPIMMYLIYFNLILYYVMQCFIGGFGGLDDKLKKTIALKLSKTLNIFVCEIHYSHKNV